MFAIRLNDEAIIHEDTVTMGGSTISIGVAKELYKLSVKTEGKMFMGMHKSDLSLIYLILQTCNLKLSKCIEKTLKSGLKYYIVDNKVLLLDTVEDIAGTASLVGSELIVRGNINVSKEDCKSIVSFLDAEAVLNTSNIRIQKYETNKVKISDSDGSIGFDGFFTNLVFDKVSNEDWMLGELYLSDEQKDNLIDKVNELFSYMPPKIKTKAIGEFCFDRTHISNNDLFRELRTINKSFNQNIVNNKKENAIVDFWRLHFIKLSLLYSKGLCPLEVLEAYQTVVDAMAEQGYKKLI